MKTHLELSKPILDLKDEYLSFYKEWKDCEEDMVPSVIKRNPSNFEEMIQVLLDN